MRNCLACGVAFEMGPARHKKFCGKKCRETHWVNNNRVRRREATRRYRAARYAKDGRWRETGKALVMKTWITSLKSEPCLDCGGRFPTCCMDFDHRPGTTKEYNVGSMVAHHYNKELIEAEIAKCDLVCANCHRIRTQERRTGSGRFHRVPEDPKTQ